MKSTLLKTLAAASLVATTHAQIHVMGASWKERGVDAPLGTILPNPGTVAAPRGYLIMDQTVLTTTPTPATYIEYGEIRNAGVVTKYYTVDTDFTAFLADAVFGDSGGRRLYGRMQVPVTIAEVANPMSTFTGSTFASGFPKKMSFDQTVFQTGESDGRTGPQIVMADASVLRSVISGSANPVKVTATTISGAANELIARLVKKDYSRIAGEAPEIVVNLPATLQLQDGETASLSVTLDPDVFPGPTDTFVGPTFQWLKDNVVIPGAVGASFTVTGGASTATNGAGSYKVTITNELGSVTSSTVVVTPETTSFATNLPASVALTGVNSVKFVPVLSPTPISAPIYQWGKGASAAGPFTAIPANIGGNSSTLTVIAGEAATGAGFYRLDVTTSAGTISSAVSNVTVAVAGTTFTFTTNLARTVAAPFNSTVNLAPVVNLTANPALQSQQWFKAPTNDPTNFTAIPLEQGGQSATFAVSGNPALSNGPGVYRMVATSTGATPQTITTVETVVTTAP